MWIPEVPNPTYHPMLSVKLSLVPSAYYYSYLAANAFLLPTYEIHMSMPIRMLYGVIYEEVNGAGLGMTGIPGFAIYFHEATIG